MLKLIFLDTETTGIDTDKCGIWQIGGIIECGKRSEEFLFECDIFEQNLFQDQCMEKTGITLEKLGKLPDPGETYDKFIELLSKYVDKYDKKDKFTAVNFGAEFDQAFLRRWFERNDDDYFGSWFWHPWICMMNVAAFYAMEERKELRNFKLGTVAEYLKIPIDESKQHNALYDAGIAREIYHKLITNR